MFFFYNKHKICHNTACTDVSVWSYCCLKKTLKKTLISLYFPPLIFFPANHRRAGHAVTNILAKELMQEEVVSSKVPTKKTKLDEKEEPTVEDAESLEVAALRSN